MEVPRKITIGDDQVITLIDVSNLVGIGGVSVQDHLTGPKSETRIIHMTSVIPKRDGFPPLSPRKK